MPTDVQLRADITNFLNTPGLSLGAGSSVTVVLSGGSPRNVQMA